ncbi:GTPase-associated protein 1-related protein [Streptomyces sp. L7]
MADGTARARLHRGRHGLPQSLRTTRRRRVAERIADTVARALLAAQPPRGELDLLCRIRRRGPAHRLPERRPLRRRPATGVRVTRLCGGTASPGGRPAPASATVWDRTRTALLTEVLRPAVRAATPGHLADITRELERAGAHRAPRLRAVEPTRTARPPGGRTVPPGRSARGRTGPLTVLKFLLLGYLSSTAVPSPPPWSCTRSLVALSRALITIGVHLGPWRAGAADSRIRPPVAEESAHLSHWAGQVWTDTGTAVALGAAELNALLFTE